MDNIKSGKSNTNNNNNNGNGNGPPKYNPQQAQFNNSARHMNNINNPDDVDDLIAEIEGS